MLIPTIHTSHPDFSSMTAIQVPAQTLPNSLTSRAMPTHERNPDEAHGGNTPRQKEDLYGHSIHVRNSGRASTALRDYQLPPMQGRMSVHSNLMPVLVRLLPVVLQPAH